MSKRKKKKSKGGNGPQWFVGKMPPKWIAISCLVGLGNTFNIQGPRKSTELFFTMCVNGVWMGGWYPPEMIEACPMFTPREASSVKYMVNDIISAEMPDESAVPTIFFVTGPTGKLFGSCWLNPACVPSM